MAQAKKIDFQRVTFSFPKEVVLNLRKKIANNQMSAYVAALVKQDLEKKNTSALDLSSQLTAFRSSLPKQKLSSLEILREIRYDKSL